MGEGMKTEAEIEEQRILYRIHELNSPLQKRIRTLLINNGFKYEAIDEVECWKRIRK